PDSAPLHCLLIDKAAFQERFIVSLPSLSRPNAERAEYLRCSQRRLTPDRFPLPRPAEYNRFVHLNLHKRLAIRSAKACPRDSPTARRPAFRSTAKTPAPTHFSAFERRSCRDRRSRSAELHSLSAKRASKAREKTLR